MSSTPTSPVDGVVVAHAGTALGSLPKHADHPDVRAAVVALRDHYTPASLIEDELAAPGETPRPNPDAHGFAVEPRSSGSVAVYWLVNGLFVTEDGRSYSRKLKRIAATLRAQGWNVAPSTRRCIFAYQPPQVRTMGEMTDRELLEAARRELLVVDERLRVAGPDSVSGMTLHALIGSALGRITVVADRLRDGAALLPAPVVDVQTQTLLAARDGGASILCDTGADAGRRVLYSPWYEGDPTPWVVVCGVQRYAGRDCVARLPHVEVLTGDEDQDGGEG